MSTYRLGGTYQTPESTGSAVAMIQVRADGVLYAWSLRIFGREFTLDGTPDADSVHGQISFNSVANFTDADAVDIIAAISACPAFVIGAGTPTNYAFAIRGDNHATLSGLRIPVYQGDRIYLHIYNGGSNGTGTAVTELCEALLYIEDGLDVRRRTR